MTHSTWRSMATLLAGLIALAGAGTAQEAQFTGEATVNIIEVPVRVVDPKTGEVVTGLTAKDFRIFEDGRRMKISNFSEISRPAAEALRQPAAKRQTIEHRPISMVYFFDLYLMRKGERDHAVAALKDRFGTSVPDGEEISIVAFDGSLMTLLDRSDERRSVLDALDEVAGIRPRGMEHEAAFTEALSDGPVTGTRDRYFYERKQRSEEYIFELERRVGRVGGAISATMARYARADARKVLVAFTPGHPRTRWAPSYASVDFANDTAKYPTKGLWQELSAEAADLGFTLFTIDSSGLQGPATGESTEAFTSNIGDEFEGSDPTSLSNQQALGALVETDDFSFGSDNRQESIAPWMERVRKDLLISASEETGGQAYFADSSVAVVEVSRSLDHYYSLAYAADHSGDGQRHIIEVTLRGDRPYELEHRQAYVDRTPSERSATRLQSTMLFGGDANPLGVRVELGEPDSRLRIGAAGSKRVQIDVQVKIPIGRLEMVERGENFIGRVSVTVFGEDAAGNQSEPTNDITPISIPADQIAQARARGYFSYVMTVELEGGRQKLWVGVEDLFSNRTSVMPQELDL